MVHLQHCYNKQLKKVDERTMLKLRWTLLMLVFLPVFLQAQECNLEVHGVVRDAHDGSILEYAIIQVRELKTGVQADSLGNYRLTGLCPGTYTLICSHLDCEPVQIKVRIKEAMTSINFYPEHHSHELEQITVKTRTAQQVTNPREGLDRQWIADHKTENLSRNLRALPGLSAVSTGSNIEKPQIHGLYGSRIAIVQQGSRLEDQQWGNEHAPNIDVLMYDRIEVIKGASSVRYGAKAMGGTILLSQDSPYTDSLWRTNFFSSVSTNAPGGSLGLTLERGLRGRKTYGLKITAMGQRYGDLATPDYNISNSGYENYAFSASIGNKAGKYTHRMTLTHRQSNTGVILASQIGNLADLERAIASDTPANVRDHSWKIGAPRQSVHHSSLMYTATSIINEQNVLKIAASYQHNNRREFDVRRAGRTNTPAVNMNLHTVQAEVIETHEWSDIMRGMVGAGMTMQLNHNNINTLRRPIIPYYQLYNPALFGFQQATWEHFGLEAGIRLDMINLQARYYNAVNQLETPSTNFISLLGSIGASFQTHSKLTIKANMGMGYRAPEVNELYADGVHLSAAAYEKGNPGLRSEQVIKYILSLENDAIRRLHFIINLFFQDFDNYIYQQPTGQVLTIAGAKLRYQYVQNDALISGADAMLRFQAYEWLTFSNNTSYLYTNNKATGKGLPLMPAFSDRIEAGLNRHITVLSHPSVFTFKLGTEYTAMQNDFHPEEHFEQPPPDYWLHFAGLSLSQHDGRQVLELRCDNLLNTRYSNYLNRLRYFTGQEGGRNITLQYRLTF